jgi:hypothetical protein
MNSHPTLSAPAFPVEATVLDGFGQVFGANVVAAGEVGDGATYFQDAVTGANSRSAQPS